MITGVFRLQGKNYLRKEIFLGYKVKQNHSLALKGIFCCKNIICKRMRWIVGDGRDTLFWIHQ